VLYVDDIVATAMNEIARRESSTSTITITSMTASAFCLLCVPESSVVLVLVLIVFFGLLFMFNLDIFYFFYLYANLWSPQECRRILPDHVPYLAGRYYLVGVDIFSTVQLCQEQKVGVVWFG